MLFWQKEKQLEEILPLWNTRHKGPNSESTAQQSNMLLWKNLK